MRENVAELKSISKLLIQKKKKTKKVNFTAQHISYAERFILFVIFL